MKGQKFKKSQNIDVSAKFSMRANKKWGMGKLPFSQSVKVEQLAMKMFDPKKDIIKTKHTIQNS